MKPTITTPPQSPVRRQASTMQPASRSPRMTTITEYTGPGFRWQKRPCHVGVFYLLEGGDRFEYTPAGGRHGLLLPNGTEEAWSKTCLLIKKQLLVHAHSVMKENRENFCWAKWEDSLTYEKTADAINIDLGPTINKQIVPLGFAIDAGADTVGVVTAEHKKIGLFSPNKRPKNVLFVRITRLSLLRAKHNSNAGPMRVRSPASPVPSSPRRSPNPRSQMFYPAPGSVSPRKRRHLPPLRGHGPPPSPRTVNTSIRSPRSQPAKMAPKNGGTLMRPGITRNVGAQRSPTTTHREGSSPVAIPRVTQPTQGLPLLPNIDEDTSKSSEGTGGGDETLSNSFSNLDKSGDLSKIVSMVADVVVDMIAEKGTLNESNNSLTLEGVFNSSSPSTSPKSTKGSVQKTNKSHKSLGGSTASMEDEVRNALMDALQSSKKLNTVSSDSFKVLETEVTKTGNSVKKETPVIGDKKGSKSSPTTKKASTATAVPEKDGKNKTKNKNKAKDPKPSSKSSSHLDMMRKRMKGITKAQKSKKGTKQHPSSCKSSSHLELMSESDDIHFECSDDADDDYNETERTYELSFGSLGFCSSDNLAEGGSSRASLPRRIETV